MNTQPILISGAGPAGLVLAITLKENGVPVRIIDKIASPRIGFKGSTIQPRSLELYNLLGVLPGVLALSGKQKPLMHHLPNGTTQIRDFLKYEEDRPDRPYNNPVLWSQDSHEEFLRTHLARKHGVQVEFGTELVDFVQGPDSVNVQLVKTLPDGATQAETVDASYLVGTDGAHSTVRKKLGLTFLGETMHEGPFVVGDIRIKTALDDNYFHTWGDQTRTITLRQFETNDGRYNFVCGGSQLDADFTSGNRENFLHTFREVTKRDDIQFGELTWSTKFHPSLRMVNNCGDGRVFVAGDACHVHSSIGAQGLNTGIQDSFNLAWKLALVYHGRASPSLLASYTAERLPVIASMLKKNKDFTAKFMKTLPNMRVSVDYELRMFGVSCRASPVVVDETSGEGNGKDIEQDAYRGGADGRICAGDRAPDAPFLLAYDGQETSLFATIFKPNLHTVLVFSPTLGTPPAVPDKIQDLVHKVVILPQSTDVGVDALVDWKGYAYKHYDVQGVKYVVVRPDGVIGASVRNEDGLQRYFSKIFL